MRAWMIMGALTCLVLAGCSSSVAPTDGGGGAGGGADGGGAACKANSPVGASVSWAEDGAAKCAVTVVAQRSTEGTSELLQLQGVTLEGASVAFAVVAYGTALEGTHTCSAVDADAGLIGTPGTVSVDFVHTGMKQTCSVTIASAGTPGGAHATGTFTATFTDPSGAAITNGVFDTPVKAPPGK